MTPRHTARGLVVHDGQLLLMERWRPGLHYFSIPGGGIESGETPEMTVQREIMEETGVEVQVMRQVLEMRDGSVRHHIFSCEYVSGEPHLPPDSPEAQSDPKVNRFEPTWIPLQDLSNLPYTYWLPLKNPIIDGLARGFPEQITIVSASTSRYTKSS